MPRTLLGCAAMAVLAFPCLADSDELDPGNADPAERLAGAGPQAGAPIPAPARAQGDESRQSDPELHEVLHGAAGVLLRQGGFRAPRGAAGHAAQGAARAGAAGLRPVRAAARPTGRPGSTTPTGRSCSKLKTDGINLLLPDVQQLRALAAGPQGAVPGRGRPGPLRRRDPDRQDDVRHVAPPGRAPDVHRQPGGHRDRVASPSAPWRRCWSSRAAPTSTGR